MLNSVFALISTSGFNAVPCDLFTRRPKSGSALVKRLSAMVAGLVIFVMVGGPTTAAQTNGADATGPGAVPDRITVAIDDSQSVTLKDSVLPPVRSHTDLGPLDPDMKLTHVTLLIRPSAEQQVALHQLLAEQRAPGSPNYHKWITPRQFGLRFGLSPGDIAGITQWLSSHGFESIEVAPGRNRISFDGTVAQIEKVFHTQIDRFDMGDEERFANATELSIPKAFDGVVVGIHDLSNFRSSPLIKKSPDSSPQSSSNWPYALGPSDVATIYDLNPLYNAGYKGSTPPGYNGSLALTIIGQTDVHWPVSGTETPIQDFVNTFSYLGTMHYTDILPNSCSDPGYSANDEPEATLDIEWSWAVAPGAQIHYVKCDTSTHTGVVDALQYAIDSGGDGAIISMSYGVCEAYWGANWMYTYYEPLIDQAAGSGDTIIVSAGDSGSAGPSGAPGCDAPKETEAANGLGVNAYASPWYVIAVGGTEFNEGSGTYWNSNSDAIGYIPELAWNDSNEGTGLSGGLWATGGGPSSFFIKPPWQFGTGMPDDGARDLPDVAMAASGAHDPYLFCGPVYSGSQYEGSSCSGGSLTAVGGTSAAAPVFAGVTTVIASAQQYAAVWEPGLYLLAYWGPNPFHDVPAGTYDTDSETQNASSNIVPCSGGFGCIGGVMGFDTGTGYDQATGLGSVDANALNNALNTAAFYATKTTVALSASSVSAGSSSPITITATVAWEVYCSGCSLPAGTVHFYVGLTEVNEAQTSNGTASVQFNPSALPAGAYNVVAVFNAEKSYRPSQGSDGVKVLTVNPAATTTAETVSPTSIGVGSTSPITISATVAPTSGSGTPTGTVTFFNGTTQIGQPTLSGGTASIQYNASSLAVGTYPITATYSGDSNYAASTSAPTTLTVTNLPSTTTTLGITASPSASQANVGSNVTFSATVAHTSGTATPTGTVTFSNNGTKLGTGTLNNSAAASYSTSSLAAGQYSVIATYGGDSNYSGSASTASALNVVDFQIAASPTTVNVTSPGQSGTTTLTITPLDGFNQTLTYACTGLPSESSCAFTSATGGETMTINTTAPSTSMRASSSRGQALFFALLLPGFLGLVSAGSRKRALRGMRLLALFCVVGLSSLWLACGGGSGSGNSGPPPNSGTPVGQSTVTVTATAGSLSHSVTITLNVQ